MFRIEDGRKEFYQWDLDRRVIVSDPTITEVHYCNKTDNCSLVVEVYEENGLRIADVPNILLQNDWDIRVYGYCGDCYTKQYERFKVIARTRPADYVYTETEIKRWEEIEQRCNDVLEIAESVSQGGILPLVANNYEELVAAFNETPKESYAVGQNIYVVTVNVPDLWVMEITEEAVAYTYTTDEAFVNEISENGYVQVGYYKLAQLETKGNLQDYAKKTDLDTKLDKPTNLPSGYGIIGTAYQNLNKIKVYSSFPKSPAPDRIPMYDENTNIHTFEPKEDLACANKKYVDDAVSGKLDKQNNSGSGFPEAYIVERDNTQVMYKVDYDNKSTHFGSIVRRFGYGDIYLPKTPSTDNSATPKKWVLDQIANAGGGGGGTKLYKHDIFVNIQNVTYFNMRIVTTSEVQIYFNGNGLVIEGAVIGVMYYGAGSSTSNELQSVGILLPFAETYYPTMIVFGSSGLPEIKNFLGGIFPSDVTEFVDTVTEL